MSHTQRVQRRGKACAGGSGSGGSGSVGEHG